MAIAGVYSYKMISFLLPIITFAVIWLEGGIKNISLHLSPPLVFLLLLLPWVGLSSLWAGNQTEALKIFISLTITFISTLLFLSCIMQATPDLIPKAYTLVKAAGFFLLLLIISQIFIDTFLGDAVHTGKGPYMLRMKPTGSILGLTAFVGCAFLWVNQNKVLSVFAFILLFLMVALSLCKTACYGMILATIIFVLSYLMPFWITRIGIIFSYTFLIFSPVLFTHVFSPPMLEKSPYLKFLMHNSFFHRFLGWEYYSKKFFENPLLGWGAGSSTYIPTEPELAPGFSSLVHPHNNSIQAYVELGLVGGVLYALFFASLFYLVAKHLKDRLSIAVCNATITFGFVAAEVTHNAWRNYWLSLATLTAGLIILFLKSREAQLHDSADHLMQPLAP